MNVFEVIIVQPIFNLLIGLYSLVGDFGVTLIIFTILVRLLLWPLVRRQLRQGRAMHRLQPELKKIKAKAKGNRQLEGMMTMELYKKHNVNPFRALGLVLLQLPIFLALFQVIQIMTLHRDRVAAFTYDALEGFGRITDLIRSPDSFDESLLRLIDLSQTAFSGSVGNNILILLIVVAGTILQYVIMRQVMPKTQTKRRLRDIMAEAANGKQADQAEINAIVSRRMSMVMPLLFLLIMVNLPGAIGLYYLVSNLIAVIQQHVYLQRLDQEEAATPVPTTTVKAATGQQRAARAQQAKTSASQTPAGSKASPKTGRRQDRSGVTITRIKAKE